MEMRIVSILTIVAVAVLLVAGTGHAQNKYAGTKLCGTCHKTEKAGAVYQVWEKTAHAKAYKTLLGDEAKKIAKEKGLKTAPHESEACLKCHVTGGGAAKNVEKTFDMKEGVGCEVCHGPASAYKIVHSKGDKAKAKDAGMIVGSDEGKLCMTCHNSESPTFKEFKYKEMWAKIEHKKTTAKK